MRVSQLMSNIAKLPSFHLLHMAGQKADGLFAIHEASVTPRQFVVLASVEGKLAASQTDIVRHTGIDRSTLAELVKRLVKIGYLRRKRSRTDARAYVVRLTDRGREVLKIGRTAATSTDDQLLAPIEPDERARFLAALARVADVDQGGER